MGAKEYFKDWADESSHQACRLVAFQRWLGAELLERLSWQGNRETQLRVAGQCRSFIERAVADLGRHGFLFRPEQLAQLITDQLDRVANYQRRDEIKDLYKYLERTWYGWVSKQSEELAAAARTAGVHRAHMTEPAPPSMPEIVRTNLEAKAEEQRRLRLFRANARRARKGTSADDAGPLLPGLDQIDEY